MSFALWHCKITSKSNLEISTAPLIYVARDASASLSYGSCTQKKGLFKILPSVHSLGSSTNSSNEMCFLDNSFASFLNTT